MADDRGKRGGPDRKRVAQHQPYEVAYFAAKWELTREQARKIIAEHGPSRAKCDAAAKAFKATQDRKKKR